MLELIYVPTLLIPEPVVPETLVWRKCKNPSRSYCGYTHRITASLVLISDEDIRTPKEVGAPPLLRDGALDTDLSVGGLPYGEGPVAF